jgi:hypothetical protein
MVMSTYHDMIPYSNVHYLVLLNLNNMDAKSSLFG